MPELSSTAANLLASCSQILTSLDEGFFSQRWKTFLEHTDSSRQVYKWLSPSSSYSLAVLTKAWMPYFNCSVHTWTCQPWTFTLFTLFIASLPHRAANWLLHGSSETPVCSSCCDLRVSWFWNLPEMEVHHSSFSLRSELFLVFLHFPLMKLQQQRGDARTSLWPALVFSLFSIYLVQLRSGGAGFICQRGVFFSQCYVSFWALISFSTSVLLFRRVTLHELVRSLTHIICNNNKSWPPRATLGF